MRAEVGWKFSWWLCKKWKEVPDTNSTNESNVSSCEGMLRDMVKVRYTYCNVLGPATIRQVERDLFNIVQSGPRKIVGLNAQYWRRHPCTGRSFQRSAKKMNGVYPVIEYARVYRFCESSLWESEISMRRNKRFNIIPASKNGMRTFSYSLNVERCSDYATHSLPSCN